MSATNVLVKEGTPLPRGMKEVEIENDKWRISVAITDGKVEILVQHCRGHIIKAVEEITGTVVNTEPIYEWVLTAKR